MHAVRPRHIRIPTVRFRHCLSSPTTTTTITSLADRRHQTTELFTIQYIPIIATLEIDRPDSGAFLSASQRLVSALHQLFSRLPSSLTLLFYLSFLQSSIVHLSIFVFLDYVALSLRIITREPEFHFALIECSVRRYARRFRCWMHDGSPMIHRA